MTNIYQIQSQRILLRQWQAQDYPKFAKMCADPEVMEFFPELLSEDDSNLLADKFASQIAERGWGFWVAEHIEDGKFLGLVGLGQASDLPIDDAIEVGWRLAREHWGSGFATEAALASLCFAFETLALKETIAITAATNVRSQQVMERLGMKNNNENFQHPRVAEDSSLREHVLYKVDRQTFLKFTEESHPSFKVEIQSKR
ncbi:MAG: GNAT family N-acetyltransferase [SAR86 cluster bacterium]|uniref:GNAT family N-acetyltransferase n=1 Tax=SAR86 cluster bacterium TaxID=2030880 RepID=A0A2A5B9H5_9GAMM|nr:MAG: GNAT family N-acetyltransferase [SAR86 cluster bacterium]